MTDDLPALAEFNLGPGTKLTIKKSRVTVRFQFEENSFTEFLDAVRSLPGESDEAVDAAARRVFLPEGLVATIIADLAPHLTTKFSFTLGATLPWTKTEPLLSKK